VNPKGYSSILTALICLASGIVTSCSNSTSIIAPNSTAQTVATTVKSGTGQNAKAGGAFSAPLVVTVTSGGRPASGVPVTFTAPSSGASGTFENGKPAETDITDGSGVAASSIFTANQTAGTYTVTAEATGASAPVDFTMTNTNLATTNYAFYVSGLEAICGSDNYYALAGSVTIDSTGNVVAGEQDYNDAFGCTSPEPSGDTISGGTLTIDAAGQGTLTLITNNVNLGVSGTETLGVQFVNSNHALIIQFDGSATSSGSMDEQTLPSTLNGSYAFTLSGVDPSYSPVARGGVFAISGSSLSNGIVDVNDSGTVVTGTAFTGTLSTPDLFGRGTIAGTGMADAIVYYVVGPEVIRIIDVDGTDSAVGSAFGQGSGTFTNGSLGNSVFSVRANIDGVAFAVAGMLTVPAAGTFQGVADNDEQGVVWPDTAIEGNYSISEAVSGVTYNGYGSLAVTSALGDFTTLGVYLTDPSLNLNDPNNTSVGGGGGLVLALDPYFAGGTGGITPQTDTATTSFSGNYAFGAQDYYTGNPGWEFDFVGQGTVSSGDLTGMGLVNDPFAFFVSLTAGIYSAVPFSGTASPDSGSAGRYTIPLTVTAGGASVPFQVVIYQANGGQLFWMDEDTTVTYPNDQIGTDLFSGSLQQQGSLAGLPGVPAVRRPMAKSR
jgi:hypothetical protein